VAGAFIVVSAVVLFLLVPRLRRRAAEGPGPARTPRRAAVAEAVSLPIEDLEQEHDPRRAIIAAYARMERSLASAGLPRASHETATEYLQRILAAVSAPAGPLSQLTLLFQEAKFSHHELTAGQRARALGALSEIREAMAA
jgi:hypothetical protein